jgi:hypothetical protein
MTAEVGELPDRWILPLRGSRITEIEWDDTVRFRLEPPGEITVGPAALFTHGPLTAPGADATTLGQLGLEKVQTTTDSRVLSAVGFKNGALRVVLDNGWHLNVPANDLSVTATVTVGNSVTWSRDKLEG